MPDAIFDHPRLARVYDALDPNRSDLDTYVSLVPYAPGRGWLIVARA